MKKIETFTLPETRFLSNFYPYKDKSGEKHPHEVRIEYEGMVYDCTENAYQAAKSLDFAVRETICKMNPYDAKKYWIDRQDEVRPDWEGLKYDLLKSFNEQKFYKNSELAQMLKDTEDAILEEGNTWDDTYWGVCNGIGQNKLGKILMEIRANI